MFKRLIHSQEMCSYSVPQETWLDYVFLAYIIGWEFDPTHRRSPLSCGYNTLKSKYIRINFTKNALTLYPYIYNSLKI